MKCHKNFRHFKLVNASWRHRTINNTRRLLHVGGRGEYEGRDEAGREGQHTPLSHMGPQGLSAPGGEAPSSSSAPAPPPPSASSSSAPSSSAEGAIHLLNILILLSLLSHSLSHTLSFSFSLSHTLSRALLISYRPANLVSGSHQCFERAQRPQNPSTVVAFRFSICICL